MDPNWSGAVQNERKAGGTKTVGMVVLAAGVLLAGWIVYTIFGLVTSGNGVAVVSNIIPMEVLEETVTLAAGGQSLPDAVFYVLGLFVYIVLLSICAGLSKALITAGAKILQPDYSDALVKLGKEMREKQKKSGRGQEGGE